MSYTSQITVAVIEPEIPQHVTVLQFKGFQLVSQLTTKSTQTRTSISHPIRRLHRLHLHPHLHFHLKERTHLNKLDFIWAFWFNSSFIYGVINVIIFTRGMDDFTPLLHDHHESTNNALT